MQIAPTRNLSPGSRGCKTPCMCASACCTHAPSGYARANAPMYLRFLGENHFASGNSLLREAVAFKPLIPRLAFITNKRQWSGHIRGQAMRAIPEEDHALIMAHSHP